jgi:TetR/AcrR family transcriptional regulator, cholesterol catabolism regulator
MNLRERILPQAVDLFIRSGIRAITMDDISALTGVSKRTIYENFKDKDELLRACLVFLDEQHDRETEKIISESINTIDLVFKVLKLGINAINSINPLFFTDLKKYHFRIWKETYIINNQKHLSKTYTMLKKGINEGLFRKEIDIEIVAKLLHEQFRIMSDEHVFPSLRYSRTKVFENIMINFLRGIATRKGLEIIEEYMDRPAADQQVQKI